MQKLEVVIGKDGSVKINALGFQGRSCLAATEALEKALGKVEGRTNKPEQFQSVAGVTIKL